MLVLADWAQRILTLRTVDAEALAGLPWPFLFHIVLGMTHLPAVPVQPPRACVERVRVDPYLFRPYQVVRSRRLNVPRGHNVPAGSGTDD